MNRVEEFARRLDAGVTLAVRQAGAGRVLGQTRQLAATFDDIEAARDRASAVKLEVLDRHAELLAQFIAKSRANGIVVHETRTRDEAVAAILEVCAETPGTIVKGKSMVSEELHLNAALEAAGRRVVETDLGEYVIQIDDDTPSHIVSPIIHKTRGQVEVSFRREGLNPPSDDPTELAMCARRRLRDEFQQASIGISGVNFAIAESGRMVIVENEGNNRLSTTAPRIHIAVMGIEKLLPRESDVPLFVQILAGSATGQCVTVYTHFIGGPRGPDELDGPNEVHIVLVDNGRRKVLDSPFREVLKCIRCGACLNVCPVYRQASGHGYGHVYPGPIGAVLAPLLDPSLADLPYASSLCGACGDVCPVKIPLPDLLLEHRRRSPQPNLVVRGLAKVAVNEGAWKIARRGALTGIMPPAWADNHESPEVGSDFRNWWKSRKDSNPPDRRKTWTPHEATGFEVAEANSAGDEAPSPSSPASGPRHPDIGGGVRNPMLQERTLESALTALGATLIRADSTTEALADLGLDPTQGYWDGDAGILAKHSGKNPDVWSAPFGVTLVEAACAETGSLLLSNAPNRNRLASLVPPHHIAIIRTSQIVDKLEDLLPNPSRNEVWITGPSRTADIEGVLVKGVHGPGELTVILLDD